MNFIQPVTKVIRNRTSQRKYQSKPVDTEAQKRIENFLKNLPPAPFKSGMRFSLVVANGKDRESLKGLGTYGFIRNNRGFIIGAVKENYKNLEDFGYMMECIILLATDLGLGTCWLGGTFTKSEFAKKISIRDTETVPAVTAIGHATEKRGKVDTLIRWGAKSHRRDPWESLFFNRSFDETLSPQTAESYVTPLEMLRIAPSASNRQPWRVVKDKNDTGFYFFLKRSPKYSRYIRKLGLADLQRVDMGIAMAHFELTAREMGLRGKWVAQDPDMGSLPENIEYSVSWVFDHS